MCFQLTFGSHRFTAAIQRPPSAEGPLPEGLLPGERGPGLCCGEVSCATQGRGILIGSGLSPPKWVQPAGRASPDAVLGGAQADEPAKSSISLLVSCN